MTRLAEALRRAADLDGEVSSGATAVELSVPAHDGAAVAVARRGVTERMHEEDAPESSREVVSSPSVFRTFDPTVAGKLVVTPTVPSAAVEQYRKLAATLHHAQVQRDIKVVMLASAVAGEGKTLTATNLALTLSHSYRRAVLLIDADLRRPSIHQVFQVPNVTGLNDGLKSETEQKLPLIQVSPHLMLLTAGRPDPDPMSGLTSERMRRIIRDAASHFDWVLIDTPPVGFLPDANLLAAMVDATVLVIRAGKSPYRLIMRAVEGVGRDRVIGVVLNAVRESSEAGAYGYYGYYGYSQAPRHARARK